ncbi:O-methyltransferase [Striga asiatica]|uniref:O-methyltransferase n=1 Tax=Striga asiatica TaxID=4170 RepID=A0A5A7PMC0_STRAF|nr:O-methyltransferase [Striga asiatica]
MEAKPITKQANDDEYLRAKSEIWSYVFGFTPMAVVKCAIELRIADTLESHGGSMTISDLSAALGCSPPILGRIMRYLAHRGFFKQTRKLDDPPEKIYYAQTALSRMLMKDSDDSMIAFVMFESSPVMLAPWHKLSARAREDGVGSAFEAAHVEDIWSYAAKNPEHSKLMDDAMSSHARVAVSEIVDQYPAAFEGVRTLVDVGGGDGTALRTLVKLCPWVRGINFDLPHVVSVAPRSDGVDHVEGDMFEKVPEADACFLMWVLHDWSDDECIQILKNCREAVPKDTGKVMIAEAVINEGGEKEEDEHMYADVRLALDMVMLAHTEKGYERTIKEWDHVIKAAGFTKYTVRHIHAIVSVIEAYP